VIKINLENLIEHCSQLLNKQYTHSSWNKTGINLIQLQEFFLSKQKDIGTYDHEENFVIFTNSKPNVEKSYKNRIF